MNVIHRDVKLENLLIHFPNKEVKRTSGVDRKNDPSGVDTK
jgi:serine/threonine protein kinase